MKSKLWVSFLRVFVGILFIFSGLVKANDPHGLAYKMQEFFEVWGVPQLESIALPLAIAMNIAEIVAGFALLLGIAMNFFSWFLLLLIVGFTFLTGYAAWSGKFKTCGCMGDCFPISSIQSFWKDVVLLIFIIIIFLYRHKIQPLVKQKWLSLSLLTTVALGSFGVQLYVLAYLPLVDCLPYKKNNYLLREMQVPEGAVADSMAIYFKYKKEGKIVEFDAANFPEDFDETNYQFVERYDKLIRKGNAVPNIQDFVLFNREGEDVTHSLLNFPEQYVLVLVQHFNHWEKQKNIFEEIVQLTKQKNKPIFLLTPFPEEAMKYNIDDYVNVLALDPVVLKTFARTNATYVLMQGDKIVQKKSYKRAKAIFE